MTATPGGCQVKKWSMALTALFVLERAMAEGLPPRSMLMALGPGFTLSTLTLERGPG